MDCLTSLWVGVRDKSATHAYVLPVRIQRTGNAFRDKSHKSWHPTSLDAALPHAYVLPVKIQGRGNAFRDKSHKSWHPISLDAAHGSHVERYLILCE